MKISFILPGSASRLSPPHRTINWPLDCIAVINVAVLFETLVFITAKKEMSVRILSVTPLSAVFL